MELQGVKTNGTTRCQKWHYRVLKKMALQGVKIALHGVKQMEIQGVKTNGTTGC